jgi:hypothetical protein
MYRFNYVTSSADGKATGLVSAEYISHQLINRSIGSVATADSGRGISLGLSDGGYIRFLLKADGAEVVYYLPNKK